MVSRGWPSHQIAEWRMSDEGDSRDGMQKLALPPNSRVVHVSDERDSRDGIQRLALPPNGRVVHE